MDTVKVRWSSGRQFVGWDATGHGVVMDASPEHKGEGTGARPIELLLYGLGGCTAMDVVSVLEKKRQDVTSVELEITGTQREDDYPHYYERIHIEYVVAGRNVDPAAVRRAIELSDEKYCSVKGSLGPQVEVTTSFRVEEAGGAGD